MQKSSASKVFQIDTSRAIASIVDIVRKVLIVEGVFRKRVRGRIDGGSDHFSNCITRPKGCRPSRCEKQLALGSLLLSLDLGRRCQNRTSRISSASSLDWEDRWGWQLVQGRRLGLSEHATRLTSRHVGRAWLVELVIIYSRCSRIRMHSLVIDLPVPQYPPNTQPLIHTLLGT